MVLDVLEVLEFYSSLPVRTLVQNFERYVFSAFIRLTYMAKICSSRFVLGQGCPRPMKICTSQPINIQHVLCVLKFLPEKRGCLFNDSFSLLDKSDYLKKSYFSTKTRVVGAQKNRLTETVL